MTKTSSSYYLLVLFLDLDKCQHVRNGVQFVTSDVELNSCIRFKIIVGHKKYIAFIAETLFKSRKFLVSKEKVMSWILEQFCICFPYLYLHIHYNGNTRDLLDIAFDHLHLWWSIYRLESYFLKSNNWFCERRCHTGSKALSLDVSIVPNSYTHFSPFYFC